MFGNIYGPNGRLPSLQRENDHLDEALENANRTIRRWKERAKYLEQLILDGGVKLDVEQAMLRSKKKQSRRK